MPRGSSAPGEPIGSGFSALIFFGSFLYQDKKEHLTCTLPKFCHGYATVLPGALEQPLLATNTYVATNKPLAYARGYKDFAPSGLLFTHSSGSSFQNYSAPSGLVKSFAPYKGLRPLLLITPLRGLNPSGHLQVLSIGGQILES